LQLCLHKLQYSQEAASGFLMVHIVTHFGRVNLQCWDPRALIMMVEIMPHQRCIFPCQ
jgi:hypothetical protein